MNVSKFLNILKHPEEGLSAETTKELGELLKEYPYFQAARALRLKGLKHQGSYKYNSELKRTAAYTTDREVLFKFITSESFNKKTETPAPVTATPPEAEQISSELTTPDFEVDQSAKIEVNHEVVEIEDTAEEQLSIGKPLEFDLSEKHSFLEWLQLTTERKTEDDRPEPSETKKKKFDLLDKFIQSNPKIVPTKNDNGKELEVNIKESLKLDKEEVMTETLARVYLEQKKYKKAIKAYEILRLKNPEKSSFFADQIKAVKKLQKAKD
ncbi:hypothetical protein [Croceivirga thetidis]|uniref:Tetratricopeptide repeat protein n=1 Tax=Croceivirga thetidis TaxID=2721623 RepID=A0ABX1GPW0_9FLAO|nr:hypothetical protein [Croceivirga thetidis]NKI31713.1 hypothetical protein [Croceivirga thetidis]